MQCHAFVMARAFLTLLAVPLALIAACNDLGQGTPPPEGRDAAVPATDAGMSPGVDSGPIDAGASPDIDTGVPESDVDAGDDTPDPGVETSTVMWVGAGSWDPEGTGHVVPHSIAGATTTPGTASEVGSLPSWIAVSPGGTHLFAIDENHSKLHAFAVTPGTGALVPRNVVDSGGQGPVHIAVDATGQWLFAAHYTSGNITVRAIGDDGMLAETPTSDEAAGEKAHQVVTDATNDYVFVPCVGSDHVAQFVFDDTTGTLSPNDPATVVSDPGQGPRHLALHPSQPDAYVVNESGSSVSEL